MDEERITEALGTLSLPQLRRVHVKLEQLITQVEAWQQPEAAQAHTAGGKTYRQELVKCGKPGCQKCSSGAGHGPYWYAYWSEGGRTRKQYIGKQKPVELESPAGGI